MCVSYNPFSQETGKIAVKNQSSIFMLIKNIGPYLKISGHEKNYHRNPVQSQNNTFHTSSCMGVFLGDPED
jgi:hypothetical protein